jgi:hypothetical protein
MGWLVQLIRFLVVELIHIDLNSRFEMCVTFMINYFSVGGDVPVDSEMILVTDFVNLKIKLVQSFGVAYRDGCIYVYLYE